MNKSDIGENVLLSKVSLYDVDRPDKSHFFIEVHNMLTPSDYTGYIAMPSLIIRRSSSKYFAKGDTEQEALKNCLTLIKDVATEEILRVTKNDLSTVHINEANK